MKAVAVCPEGKELRDDPSGRITRQEYLSELTPMAMSPAEKASETSMRPHELRPPDAAGFQGHHRPGGSVLEPVVVVVAERTAVPVAQTPEVGIVGLHHDAAHDQRRADEEHAVGFCRGVAVDAPSELPSGAHVCAVR